VISVGDVLWHYGPTEEEEYGKEKVASVKRE